MARPATSPARALLTALTANDHRTNPSNLTRLPPSNEPPRRIMPYVHAFLPSDLDGRHYQRSDGVFRATGATRSAWPTPGDDGRHDYGFCLRVPTMMRMAKSFGKVNTRTRPNSCVYFIAAVFLLGAGAACRAQSTERPAIEFDTDV